MIREGGCLCGAVRFKAEGEPINVRVCHCRNCQQRTGSAFGWSAYFPNENVVATIGAFRTYSIAGANVQERVFCGTCGTTLFWRARDFEGMTGIAGGCFGETPLPEPTMTVANETRCPWVTLPEGWKTVF